MVVYIDSPNLNLKVLSLRSTWAVSLSCQSLPPWKSFTSLVLLPPPPPVPCHLLGCIFHIPPEVKRFQGPVLALFCLQLLPWTLLTSWLLNTVHVLTSHIVPTNYLKLFRIFKWCSLPLLQLILNCQSSKPSIVFLFHLLKKPDALHWLLRSYNLLLPPLPLTSHFFFANSVPAMLAWRLLERARSRQPARLFSLPHSHIFHIFTQILPSQYFM